MRERQRLFILLVLIGLCISRLALAQTSEEPVDTLHHTPLYHILFDTLLQSRTAEKTEEGQVERFKGNFERIHLKSGGEFFFENDSTHKNWITEILCPDDAQYAEINRVTEDTVEVNIFNRDRNTRGKGSSQIFSGIFDATHTRELRLRLGGGDDYAIVKGTVNSSIPVRVVGDEGSDEMVDSSHVIGHLLYILPIKRDEKKTYFYGDPSETNFIYSPSTVIRSLKPSEDSLLNLDNIRNWGHAWEYNPLLGFTSDDGGILGASFSLIQYSFLADPCRSIMTWSGFYATTSGHFDFNYTELFQQVLGGKLAVAVCYSSFDHLNFFGYGNETTVDDAAYKADHYKLDEKVLSIEPKYSFHIFENSTAWGAAAFRSITTDPNVYRDSSFIRRRHQYGVGTLSTTQLSYGIEFDSRDEARAATKGLYAGFSSSWVPEILDNKYAYTRLKADIRLYVTANLLTPITFAGRLSADKLFGEHPFYESAFAGGANSLRGYYKDRFAGEGSYLGSVDVRIKLASVNLFVPATIGLLLFADAGRVFIDNDFSNLWHTSFGGGLWVAPISPVHTIALTIGHSTEATQIYLTTGFAF